MSKKTILWADQDKESIWLHVENMIGLGIAGNFAGHLEQAGEAEHFEHIEHEHAHAPKGLFPFYLPTESWLPIEVSPYSMSHISLPDTDSDVQIEPEVSIIFDIVYDDTKVIDLIPRYFAAFNDCSVRRPPTDKISQRKNWGPNTKWIASSFLPLEDFSEQWTLHDRRIECFQRTNGKLHTYGVDSAVSEYNFIYDQLKEWLICSMNHQTDHGQLESISSLLAMAEYPAQALIAIWATRYTDHGNTTYLSSWDESYVIIYDETKHTPEQIRAYIDADELDKEGISFVRQEVL